MRKYFSQDFNNMTSYIARKRYKSDNFIVKCLKLYLRTTFPEFGEAQKNEILPEIENMIFLLGSLLYPKDMAQAFKNSVSGSKELSQLQKQE